MLSERVREMLDDGVVYPLAEGSEEELDFIKLCSNESPLGPSPKAVEAIKAAAEEIGQYPRSFPTDLKRAIGEYLDVDPRFVCVGNGSDEVMDLACKSTMDPGDKALIPIPTFSQYELACRVNSVRPKFVELEGFQWDSDFLVSEMADVRVAFISRPNNPTGNSIEESGLRKLLETGKMIIVDEAYVEFSDYSIVDWVQEYENLLVLRTFSKIFGLAGVRVGYGVGNEKLTGALERVRPPFSVNRLAQKAAVAALEDMEFVRGVKETVTEEKGRLMKRLGDLGFEVLPSDTNFIMAKTTPLGVSASDLCGYLMEQRILIRNLAGVRGAGPEWVRITVGKPEQNKRLIRELEKYKEVEE